MSSRRPPPPPPRAPRPPEPTVIAPATDEQVGSALGVTPMLARELRERLDNVRSAVRAHPDRVFGAIRVAAIVDATEAFERIIACAVQEALPRG